MRREDLYGTLAWISLTGAFVIWEMWFPLLVSGIIIGVLAVFLEWQGNKRRSQSISVGDFSPEKREGD